MTAPDDLITVLVPCSPIPSHPSTEVLDATLTSVRAHLPDARIVVMADGVRAEQEDRAPAYQEFKAQVARDIAEDRWGDTTLCTWEYHQHQARMTRATLASVRTPLVLFVEGDTTLEGTIDWPGLCAVLCADDARVVRFHHEAQILEPHEWLNVNGGKVEMVPVCVPDLTGEGTVGNLVPLIATAQWSQRPHLARADYCRWLLGPRHFHPDSRTMIEDVFWAEVLKDWQNGGRAGWDQHRLYVYAEQDHNGSIRHSATCDGRQSDPKYPMTLEPPPGGSTFDEWRGAQE